MRHDGLIVGLVLATAVALIAHRARALSTSGAAAAIVTGTAAAAAGWSWALILITYFMIVGMSNAVNFTDSGSVTQTIFRRLLEGSRTDTEATNSGHV